MELGTFLANFFSQIWRIFLMDTGIFGLKFSDILLGGFVVALGASIFKFLFVPSVFQTKEGRLRDRLLNKNYEKKDKSK